MKMLLWLAGLLILSGCMPELCPAQNVEGQIIASQYGQFSLTGTAENSFFFSPSNCQVSGGGKNFNAFTQGVPVRVIEPGNPSLNEVVVAGLVNISACSVQLAVHNDHLPPFYLTSGTAGLQEAINANSKGIANTIILSADWYALGGSPSIIASVTGTTSLGLVDVTTTPFTWYAWNGSNYAITEPGAGCSSGCVTELNNISGGLVLTPGSNITITPSGQTIQIGAVSGVPSVNGVKDATTIAAGSNITVSTTGSTITVAAAGGAGTGAVGAGTQYQDPTYPNAGSTTTVGALANRYTVPTGLSTTQLNTLFSRLSNSTVAIQNGDGTTPFGNSNFDAVQDLRETYPVTDWNVKESGAQCDLQGGFGSVTQGSPTLTFTSGYSVSAADVGKNIEMVSEVSGEPTRFDATVTAVDVGTDSLTLSTPSPFTVSQYSVQIGHRDDAAVASAFGNFTYHRPIAFPVGNCWSDTIAVYGQSFHGQSSSRSMVTGLAGDDVFAGMDPTQGGFQGMAAGMQIHDMRWEIDPRINASQPWQDVNPSGTVTQHAATYRPEGIFTVWANDPLGPGWIQGPGANNTGATNGVAVTTQNSALICIPSSETEPPVGQTIIFPYFASIFTSTVASLTGSGCAGGSNPLTMAAALPNTSGYTSIQSEWFAGTNVQTITQSNASGSYANGIPATGRTYPFYLRLANNINPPATPNPQGTGSNVAPYGLVQIDGEQFSYFSDSSYPASTSGTYWIQITAGAQNGTTAASHATGATIVPLNPFQPTWPWPVTPSLNAGVMPANAVYFPAWNIGNAIWSQPVYNGVDWVANAALSYSDMHDIVMTLPDYFAGSGGGVEGGPNAFQQGNATAGMYIATSTFKSKFSNIRILDPQFGIFEGTPSINAYGMFGADYPTANGSNWKNITIQSAGYDTEFIEAQNDTKEDFLTFCQNGGETGTSWPGQALGVVGCGAGWTESGTYDDKGGGGSSDNTNVHSDNWYIEAETGSQSGLQPTFELNCGQCSYGGGFSMGGASAFIEGSGNNFSGNQIVGLGTTPIINYGAATTMRFVPNASLGGVSNIYGEGSLLNYGPNGSMSGRTDGNAGPFGAVASGNNLAPVTGQTAEMFATGNDLAGPEYVSGNSAVLYPDQLPLGDWTFDDTAPVSHSYSACTTSPGQGCASDEFNSNSRVVIGPDQKIVPGKYIVHYAFKGTVATSFFFELDAVNGGSGACSGGGSLLILNPSITTSWVQGSALVDFTNAATCDLQLVLHNSTLDTTVEMAYLVFTPVWTSLTLPVNTPEDNAACTPGAFLGSDASYLYICTASGTVKRAALSAY